MVLQAFGGCDADHPINTKRRRNAVRDLGASGHPPAGLRVHRGRSDLDLETSAPDTREGDRRQRSGLRASVGGECAQRPTRMAPGPNICLVTAPVTFDTLTSPDPAIDARRLCAVPFKRTVPEPAIETVILVTEPD